ncbi:MAG: alpha/beta hydrolase [Deltaproteobacteria bacterium]|nr:alpha/beta hydrolase [Deltaproteobacteria bacterium]
MRIRHGRIALELHQVRRGDGPALLLLHGLYEESASWGEAPAVWAGSIYALDFSGHGRSEWLTGGGYTPELLAADADAALAQIGRAALAGAGVGAYVALLLAGTRPELVPAALLLSGAGLAGGGAQPDFTGPRFPLLDSPAPDEPPASETTRHDPLVRALARDVRPPDYAAPFAHAARRLLLLEDGTPRPPWWQAVRQAPGAQTVAADLHLAFTRLAQLYGEQG